MIFHFQNPDNNIFLGVQYSFELIVLDQIPPHSYHAPRQIAVSITYIDTIVYTIELHNARDIYDYAQLPFALRDLLPIKIFLDY